MLNNHVITFCDDKDALQTWLSANYEANRSFIFRAYGNVAGGAVTENYIFVAMDKLKTIKSDDETKTLSFVVVRNQQQLDALQDSPLQVLGAGDCNDPENCPYSQIMSDPLKLAKYREVVSVERQAEQFGDFRFCTINS